MAYVMLHGEATLDLLEIAPRELQFRQVPGLAGDFLQLQGKFMLVSDEPPPQVGLRSWSLCGSCSDMAVAVCTQCHPNVSCSYASTSCRWGATAAWLPLLTQSVPRLQPG